MGLISNGTTIFDNGSMASGFGGSLKFISKQTASTSSFINFTTGIDSTYKEYIFYFVDLHPSTGDNYFEFNMSTDGGSNYNATKTSTGFYARHAENADFASIAYEAAWGLAQSTGNQLVGHNMEGADADASLCGSLQLFNPSSTTFVKHYIGTVSYMHDYPAAWNQMFAGYCNTTSAINAVSFIGEYGEGTSGNIDSGDICLYGIS